MERRKEARKVGRFKRPREKKGEEGGRIDSRSEGYVCIFSLAAKWNQWRGRERTLADSVKLN